MMFEYGLDGVFDPVDDGRMTLLTSKCGEACEYTKGVRGDQEVLSMFLLLHNLKGRVYSRGFGIKNTSVVVQALRVRYIEARAENSETHPALVTVPDQRAISEEGVGEVLLVKKILEG